MNSLNHEQKGLLMQALERLASSYHWDALDLRKGRERGLHKLAAQYERNATVLKDLIHKFKNEDYHIPKQPAAPVVKSNETNPCKGGTSFELYRWPLGQ